MARRKKEEQPLTDIRITGYAAEGKSIGHLEDGRVVFVTGAVPGDVAQVQLGKSKKSFAEGRAVAILVPSPDRIAPFCPHFGVCGGCKWQMLPYAQQLVYKQQQAGDQLNRLSGIPLPEIAPIVGSEADRYYRNKLEFTFCAQRYFTDEEIQNARTLDVPLEQEPALGFHAPGRFDKVVPIQTCYLQPEPTNILLAALRRYTEEKGLPYYHPRTHEGWLRNVIIRVATTGEVLINLVVKYEWDEALSPLLDYLLAEVPGITSLHYTINTKVNDTIYDQPVTCWYGKPYIEEKLEDFVFRISPKSFFQTNTRQAEKLYQITRDFAGLTGSEVIYDLYCGTGSIGIFCSKMAKKVIGIETVADAIADAKINAAANNIRHAEFFCGDVAKIATDEFFATHGRPDVIITDPPRAGMHEDLIRQLLQIRAPRIVYVSCNPATQARDLALLNEAYEVQQLQPVDMFPQTHHLENVALLTLR